ncbi:MAG: hypothetical protein M1826_005762 [Phylliscum demangeonii]|nr:MAG: hypothetical protein M1826_005762 [Phylliscum demangeonii]
MSSDDHYIFDVLSSIADSIDRHIDQAAAVVKDTLSSYKWLEQSLWPTSPPRIQKPVPVPRRISTTAYTWLTTHKALAAAVLVSLGGVIAGSVHDAICKSLSLDLERRGFVVYVLVGSVEEEQTVRNESRADIRPLTVDVTDPPGMQHAIDRFHNHLKSPQHALEGVNPHHLHLAGFILVPDMTYTSGPIEAITPDLWSDALNVKILGTVATTQAFLGVVRDFRSRILLLTPSILPSLCLPFHGMESSIVAALTAFTRSLRSELAPAGADVCQLKLGAFDLGGRNHPQTASSVSLARADLFAWPSLTRHTYARDYIAQSAAINPGRTGSATGENGLLKGSHLRELHIAVFDALTGPRPPRVWHVGRGSLAYQLVGDWAPSGLVGWMLGTNAIRPRAPGDGKEKET